MSAPFSLGTVIRYSGRVVRGMVWEGRVKVVTVGDNPHAFKPVGTTGSVWGHVSISRATTAQTWPLGMPMREYFIGGVSLGGFYHWADEAPELIKPNWEMRFMVDGNQSIFGSNRNDSEGAKIILLCSCRKSHVADYKCLKKNHTGAERKYYSGRVHGSHHNLQVSSTAVFESGQEIGYSGKMVESATDSMKLNPAAAKALLAGVDAVGYFRIFACMCSRIQPDDTRDPDRKVLSQERSRC
eukprot:SAG31_NODE_2517_length_5576_cov_3.265839_8_plen_241_part_00